MRLLRRQKRQADHILRVADDTRIYAFGDIHGRLDLLSALLEKVQADVDTHDDDRSTQLVFLGDYVDRGDESRGVLHRLSELRASEPLAAVFLKGNHEDAMLRFIDDPQLQANWLNLGGEQTLASFGIARRSAGLTTADISSMHEEFCDAIRPYLSLLAGMVSQHASGDVFLSHAGANPERPLAEQSEGALLWGHPGGLVDQPIKGKRIVHGHYDNPNVQDRPGRICIDTGAYYSGILTALRLDHHEELVQTNPG